MDRREFLRTTAAAVPAIAAGTVTGAHGGAAPSAKRTFKLKYAPHFGMFEATAGKDLFDQLRFMADQGFRAFEDNGLMGRPADVQQKIGDTLAKLGMTMGVFVIDGGDNWKVSLATGKQEFKDVFLKACRSALDTQKRVNARWATVVPGYFARELPMGLQTGHVVDALRAGAEILEPSKLAMVLEPLSDNPDLFLRTSDQAYAVCRAVNSPSCKILYDMFHMQRNEGDMITRIELAWNEIAYFQIGDNPGRKEPGTGEVNYRNIFKFIRDRAQASNREFVLGMEHGNFFPGAEGEQKLIEAYVRADDF